VPALLVNDADGALVNRVRLVDARTIA